MSFSLTSERLELARGPVNVDNELVLGTLLNGSGVDELAHQVRSSFVRLALLLQLENLVLELLNHGELGLGVRFFLGSRFLIGLDLCQGPSSLGALLEHVGRDSLGNYYELEKVRFKKVKTSKLPSRHVQSNSIVTPNRTNWS